LGEMTFKTGFAALAVLFTRIYGGFDNILFALVVFIVFDYLTGILAAVYNKTLSSYTGLKGIVKKVLMMALVGVAATLDNITGINEPYIRSAVIYFLLANEGISILENVARAGIPIPSILTKILEQLRDKDGAKGGSRLE